MDVREVVRTAKLYVSEMLADEQVSNVGLEEIDHDTESNNWLVTIGFSRPWNSVRDSVSILTGDSAVKRVYRVVTVNDSTGRVLSMKKRESVEA